LSPFRVILGFGCLALSLIFCVSLSVTTVDKVIIIMKVNEFKMWNIMWIYNREINIKKSSWFVINIVNKLSHRLVLFSYFFILFLRCLSIQYNRFWNFIRNKTIRNLKRTNDALSISFYVIYNEHNRSINIIPTDDP